MVLWIADYASQGNWFKIAQRGLINGTIQEGMWGQKILGGENWDGTPELWTDTIPAALKPGNYLIRHEIIALHITNKPQWNLQCAHLTATGNGTQSPEKAYLATVPQVYSMDQPEINIDVYAPGVAIYTVYNIPGPPVWNGEKVKMDRLVNGFKGSKGQEDQLT
ncbi:glycosyl hydrolase family 61-domain-containing protein [Hyaloscypha finlandica]|nr:glycosyl hydrolase family 61-domain-containing protein [Hyaloscypha finlandica]